MNGTSKFANGACLLFDDEPVESKHGVVRRMMAPTRCEAPVLVPERRWEIDAWCGDPGASVLQDTDGTCHLWYMLKYADGDVEPTAALSLAAELDEKTRADFASMKRYILCYARSQDGIHWERPDCGIFEYDGSLRNNIVMSARLGGTVILDPNAPPEERMKMLLGGGPRIPYIGKGQSKPSKDVYHAIYGASSPDGVHWRMSEAPVLPWYTDTTNVVYWDDQREAYVAFVRWNHGMHYENGSTVVRDTCFYRAIGRAESTNFHKFPAPEMILSPTEQLWSPPVEGTDYYNTAAMKYPFAPDSYFLFISMFSHKTGMLGVYLASSRDGVKYEIWPEPYVEMGQDGTFDARCMYMAAGIVDVGAEFYMYYRGYSYVHRCERHPFGSYNTKGEPVGMGRLRVRRDGFVAQIFAPEGGELVTHPREVTGGRLFVNCDAGACGELRAEILDDAGQPVAGFETELCHPVWGNDVHTEIRWSERDLATLVGKKIRLRFTGASVRLFSFQFGE